MNTQQIRAYCELSIGRGAAAGAGDAAAGVERSGA